MTNISVLLPNTDHQNASLQGQCGKMRGQRTNEDAEL